MTEVKLLSRTQVKILNS